MRPIKDPADKRTETPCVRYTPAESVQLEKNAEAAGMSVSDFTRFRTLGVKPNRPTTTPERQALIRGLGQLGNIRADLNRLVKDRQQHHFVKPEDAEAAFKAITLIADQINIDLSGDGD
jgi:hypothetical protein